MTRPVLALAAGVCWLWLAVTAVAQETATPDYEAWQVLANSVTAVLDTGRASNEELDALRAEIVVWRDRFLEAQDTNAGRIGTLTEQVAALGPPPADGQSEPAEIASRRAELAAELERLRAPVIAAEEAHTAANGLVREIDATIRSRQAQRLLEVGPSPLNPSFWGPAARQIGGTFAELGAEWRGNAQSAPLTERLPRVILFLGVALLLLLRGRAFFESLARAMVRRAPRGKGVWAFLLSLGQIVLPTLGLFALAEAALATGRLGPLNAAVVAAVPLTGLTIVLARWLAGQLFPKPGLPLAAEGGPLELSEMRRAQMRVWVTALGILLALSILLSILAEAANWDRSTLIVAVFPLVLLASWGLFRIGRMLVQEAWRPAPASGDDQQEAEAPFGRTVAVLLGRPLILVAIVTPVVSAIGFANAAGFLLFPSIMTLGLLALLLILQRLSADIYYLVTRTEDDAREALIPVLIGFLLTIVALPTLSLIWGARVSDLTELWDRFRQGFSLGQTRISPGDFLTFLLIFAIGFLLTRLLQGTLRSTVLPRTRLDVGGRNAIVSGVGYLGIFLAAVIAISSAGINLSNLAIVAGALSVGIGFGLQNIVSNFVSGIILLIERPISEGDWIEVAGQNGYVRDISVRSTRIETFDRTDVIVPNADLVSGTVTNYTRGNNVGRVIVPVGVAYGTDTRRVERVLRGIAEAHPMVSLNPPPAVVFRAFGADSLDFEIRAILRDVNWLIQVQSDMNHEIARRFAEEGIEIPFAQRDLWLRNPEVLRGDKETR